MFCRSLGVYFCESITGYLEAPAKEVSVTWKCRGKESPQWIRINFVDMLDLDVRSSINNHISIL